MNSIHKTFSVSLIACLVGLAASAAHAQERVLAMAPADTALSQRQAAILELGKASSAALGASLVSSRIGSLANPSASARITLALGDDTELTASRVAGLTGPEGGVWRGTIDDTGGQVALMWWNDGTIVGTVQNGDRLYSIRPMGGSLHAVVALSEGRMPPDHAPQVLVSSKDRFGHSNAVQALRAVTSRGPRRSPVLPPRQAADAPQSAAGEVVIDVMVAYTRKAAAHYSDVRRDLIELAIEEANESFRRSNLGHVKLRLVHTYATDYAEEGTHFDHVWRLADKGDGYMDEVHELRNAYRADVVLLIVDDAAGCGLATRVHPEADEAFAVVHHECAATTHSVAHEVGHIIGARHELAIDKIMTPFPHGHGYVNGNKWRDIMSYRDSCGGCPRVPVWSSPTVLVRGEPAGTEQENNARVIAEESARVAAFR
ncbi:MAG TPA: M12 family metallo-peptidase [Hyphomicrobiaceae bacterium]|nr:M12 family metallo-peptidase [Hyphomicrobiaceae bacterium]